MIHLFLSEQVEHKYCDSDANRRVSNVESRKVIGVAPVKIEKSTTTRVGAGR